MEGGIDQPVSTMFYIKQRTNGVKEAFARAFSPDNLAQDLFGQGRQKS